MTVMRCMEGASSVEVASWIETLNASVIPMKPRTALRNLIVQRDISGRAFSMVLNGHALADFNLPDVSLAMATKIRKCWHADFPESVGIKAPGSVCREDQSQRHDACQDGADYSGYEGYAGYKPGPGTGCSGVNQGSADDREAVSGHSAHPALASMKSSKRTLPMVTLSLDMMRAALDSVAERADLHRQDMYLGLRDVLPDEVWEPLWASYTSDLVREQMMDKAAQRSVDLRRSAKAPRTSDKSSALLVKNPCHAPSAPEDYVPRRVEDHGKSTQDSNPQDELAHLPELRSRLEGPRECASDRQALDQQDAPCDDDLQSNADTLRSEAQTIASDALSHWLGKAGVSRATLSPFEIAHWLRTLPKDRLKADTLKAIAKQVLDKDMDEDAFGAAIATGLDSFGLSDQRQGIVLQRYFKQKQNEAAMAEAAKQEGALIRKFNAKLESKVWQA